MMYVYEDNLIRFGGEEDVCEKVVRVELLGGIGVYFFGWIVGGRGIEEL